MLGVHRVQEIRARITRRMDLWDRGLHAGLVGDAEAEGATRVGGKVPPPQRKTRTSRDPTQNVCTCCCRKSM